MIKGRNIMVYLGTTLIAGLRSNDLQGDCDLIEKASPSSGQWREYEPGCKTWSVQTGFLVPAVANIKSLLTIGTTYTLVVKDRSAGTLLQGTAICKSAKFGANIENLCTGTFAFQGTGPLVDPSAV